MSLSLYRKKRKFDDTPEPKGGKAKNASLTFVIQKHAASHLHYDFRLEMDGVLKSWAIPKGPSTDPSVKRLAMMVEDHPYDYRNFEGIIPKGNYGAGTVIVWDEGTYEPIEKVADKKGQEKLLLKELKAGSLKITMHGKKLKGEFALVRTHGMSGNSWLLIKHRDKYASEDDITKKEKSVVSGKTIEKTATTSKNIYGKKIVEVGSTAKDNTENNKPKKKADSKKVKKKPVQKVAEKHSNVGAKQTFPKKIAPMLATLVDKPFDENGWLYEVKWDGYRCIAFLNKGKVSLHSRNDKSFDEKFYPVHTALQELELNAVLDGEVVVVNEDGISNFGDLQNWRSEADGELKFYVFDLLWHEGYSLLETPLSERRALLKNIMPDHSIIKMSNSFESKGTEFFEVAKKAGLEGIMAKKSDSFYAPGARSKEWLKIKIGKRQEVVIGGFTNNDGSSKAFSALLVGVFKNKKLHYTGKIGTGFSDKLQQEMMKKFKPLIIKNSPFTEEPDVNKPSRFRPDPPHAKATWIKPQLVCEVSFTEMTSDGVMRHPSFEGMRIDKKANDVVEEIEKPTKEIVKKDSVLHKKNIITKKEKTERKTFLNPTDETQVRKINGHELKFTNLSKIFWPKEKITKRDMLNYYYQAAPFILPYMKDRPQSLNRHPNGINGESFYQKDVTGKVPDWVKTFPYHSAEDDRDKNFMVCTDESDLLYIASLGCIEMNPWSSRVQSPDNPDWCIIDLDPDNNKFDQVVEAAQSVNRILESVHVKSYCKTSGSTGLHIYIPLGAKYNYEASKEFARIIVTMVNHELPKFTSIKRATKDRKGKIYLDFLQNRPQATLATAYSIRPKPGATVSMPLHWDEVEKGLSIQDFNINNAMDRLKKEGDIFKPVLGKGIDLKKILKALNAQNENEG